MARVPLLSRGSKAKEIDLTRMSSLFTRSEETPGKVSGEWGGILFDNVCVDCPVVAGFIERNDASRRYDMAEYPLLVPDSRLKKTALRFVGVLRKFMTHDYGQNMQFTANGNPCDSPESSFLGQLSCSVELISSIAVEQPVEIIQAGHQTQEADTNN